MKLRRTITSLALSFVVGFGALTPTLVLAHNGEDDPVSSTLETVSDKTETEIEHAKEVENEGISKANKARESAKNRLSELKSKVETRTKEIRVKACDARKSQIKERLGNMAERSQKHSETFDSILARVEEFVTKKNLTVENSDALKAAIDAAAQKVETEVATLQALKGSVDCNDPDTVASGLEAFKTQATIVKDALKAYREAIRTYMQAVKKAAEAIESTSSEDGGTQ